MRVEFIKRNPDSKGITNKYLPVVVGELTIEKYRNCNPSKIEFQVLKDDNLAFDEGDIIQFYAYDDLYFEGYVFQKERDKDGLIKVIGYDQIRYLLYKDTICYKNKTLLELIAFVCDNFNLNFSAAFDPGYVIDGRIEENSTFLDTILKAIEITRNATGQDYIFFDKAGKIYLTKIEELKTNYLLHDNSGENFSYKSSIDGETFNSIKLEKDDGKEYFKQDQFTIEQWGYLQYYEKVDNNVDLKTMGENLLNKHNRIERTLSFSNVVGIPEFQGGTQFYLTFNLGDKNLEAYELIVDKVKHKFSENNHFMDLELSGFGW